MEEDLGSYYTMKTGAVANLIWQRPRGPTTTEGNAHLPPRLLFAYLGFKNGATIVLCGECCKTFHITDSTLDKAAAKMYNHYSNNTEPTDCMIAHPTDCLPSEGEIRRTLINFEQESRDFKTSVKRRNVLFAEEDIEVFLGKDRFKSLLETPDQLVKTTMKVCTKCFCEVKALKSRCCVADVRDMVVLKRKNGGAPIPIFPREGGDETLLVASRPTPRPSLPSLSSPAAPAPAPAQTTTTTTTTTAFTTPPSNRPPLATLDLSPIQIQSLSVSTVPIDDGRGSKFYAGFVPESKKMRVYIMEATVKTQLSAEIVRTLNQYRDNATHQQHKGGVLNDKLLETLDLTGVSDAERLKMAKCHKLDRKNGRDELLRRGVKDLVGRALYMIRTYIGEGTHVEKIIISRIAQVRSDIRVVAQGGDAANPTQGRFATDFDADPGTVTRWVTAGAKMFKIALERNVAGSEGLMNAMQEADAANDGDLNSLVAELFVLGFNIATSADDRIIKSVVAHLASVLPDETDATFDGDEHDEDQEFSAPGFRDTNEAKAIVRTTDIRTLRSWMNGLNHILKLCIATDLAAELAQRKRTLESYQEIMTEHESYQTSQDERALDQRLAPLMENLQTLSESPVDYVLRRAQHPRTMMTIATLIASVANLEGPSPSLTNTCSEATADEFGPRFRINSLTLGFPEYRKLARDIMLSAYDAVARSLSISATEVREILTDPTILKIVEDDKDRYLTFSGESRPLRDKWRANAFMTFSADPNAYRSTVEELREYIFVAIDVLGSSTMRTTDLINLRFGRSGESLSDGNIFGCFLESNEMTAVIITMVIKNSIEGISVLPVVTAKLLLLLLRLLQPVLELQLLNSILDPIQQACPQVDLGEARTKIQAAIHTSLVCNPSHRVRLTSKALRTLDEVAHTHACVEIDVNTLCLKVKRKSLELELDLSSGDLLDRINETEMCRILKRIVCVGSLKAASLTIPQKRNLFVNLRANFGMYVKNALAKAPPGPFRDALASLTSRESNEAAAAAGFLANSTRGHHSVMTLVGSYASGKFVGNAGAQTLKIPNVIFKAGLRGAEETQLLVLSQVVPTCRSTGLVTTRTLGPLPSVDEELTNRSIHDERDGLLLRGVQNLYGAESNFLPGQQLAMRAVLHNKDDLVLALSCGTGKTLSFVVPLMQQAPESIVIVVTHLRALLENALLAMDHLRVPCEEFDLSKPRFQSGCFMNPAMRPPIGEVTFVYMMCDAFANNLAISFVTEGILSGRIKTIVFDEAHAMLLSLTFRSIAMERVILASRSMHIQRIFVTGTCPGPILETLVRRFELRKELCTVVRSPSTATAGTNPRRQAIHLAKLTVKSSQGLRDAALRVLDDYVTASTRRVLVFCMTLQHVDEIANAITQRVLLWGASASAKRRVEVIPVTSEIGEGGRNEFFRKVYRQQESDELLIIVSTSVLAEGVDLPEIDTVLVLGGTFQGMVSFVQMANRAGRGAQMQQGSPIPDIILLYAPLWAESVIHGTPERRESYEESTLLLFPEELREKAKRMVTFSGLDCAFTDPALTGLCGSIVIDSIFAEGQLSTAELGPRCGSCTECLGGKSALSTIVARINETFGVAQENRDQSRGRNFFMSHPRAVQPVPNDTRLRMLAESESDIRRLATEFLAREDRAHVCALCGNQFHFPNKCLCLPSILDPNSCWHCFQTGHTTSMYRELLNRKVDGAQKLELRSCAVVFREHPSFNASHPPCTGCWLVHDREFRNRLEAPESHGNKPNSNNVRACFLRVWTMDREEFFQTCHQSLFLNHERPATWRQFFEWGVYATSGLGLQHAYRIVNFVRMKRERAPLPPARAS